MRRADGERGAVIAERHTLAGVPLEHTAASEVVVGIRVRCFQVGRLRDLCRTGWSTGLRVGMNRESG